MLFRKMLRDLKKNIVQFVSIFLMTFMGILIFTGLNAVGQGMDQSSKRFYKETNLADAFLYGASFSKEEAIRLEKEEMISQVERRMQIDVTLQSNSKKTIQLNIVETNQISENHLVEGEPFDPSIGGIWLDSSYADMNSIQVGDRVSLMVEGLVIKETVKGLIMNPEYIYALKDDNEVVPDHKNYGYAFLSSERFSQSFELRYNQILIKSDADKKRLDEIKIEVFKDKPAVLVMKDNLRSIRMFQNEVNQMRAMQTIFPIAFLLIAIMTTLTTMTRIIVNQRTQIGSLKAIGFSDAKILRHYMSYGTFIGTVSGVLGVIIGPILLPNMMFAFQKGFYTMPEWKGEIEPIASMIVIICILCCGLSGFFACRKELQGVTAQILRPKAPKTSKHTRLEKSKWWNGLKFDFQWNIRDLLRNKLRSAITVFGIVGCMALIICAFGLKDTIEGISDMTYKELNTYDTKVGLPERITAEKLLVLQDNKNHQFIQESSIEMDIDGEIETTMLTVVGEGNYIKQKDLDNNLVVLPKTGIAITNKLAQLYNLGLNDMLRWRDYGTIEWITSEITELIRNPIGQGIYVNEESYIDMNKIMKPTAFLTDEVATAFAQGEFSSVQSKEDLVETMETMMETMNVMIAVLVFAAVILGVVVLYNLGVLSFHEKLRELTTLKVLGFQYDKLRKLLQMQNIWLTLFGTLLGVPGGYLLLSYMLKFMGDSFDLLPRISILSLGYSIMGTLLLSIVVNWFLSRRIKTIDMVSALKAVE